MKLISIKTVILKIIRDLGLGDTEIPSQDMVEWIAEAMQHIGAYTQYVEKECTIEIEDYTGKLPCDFYSTRTNQISYKIQGDSIISTLRNGHITCFRYLAFPTDEEGYPLIPDHISYSSALFWKVAMQLAIRGELKNKELSVQYCKTRWDWYCKQAGSAGGASADTMAKFARLYHSRVPHLLDSYPILDNGFRG